MLKKHKLDIACSLLLAVGLFIVLYFLLGFAKIGIDAPYSYAGVDDFMQFATIKSIGDNGWFWQNNYTGAPYGADVYDFAAFFLKNVENLISKILMFIVKDVFISTNIQYLLVFSWCALSSFIVLRVLKIRLPFALLGAGLYALAPYIFSRGISHLSLSSCYFVPFSILLCVWCIQEDDAYLVLKKGFFRSKKNLVTIILALLIANNGIGYYQFFTCFLLCVVGVSKAVSERRVSSLKKPLLIIGLIICFLPAFYYAL